MFFFSRDIFFFPWTCFSQSRSLSHNRIFPSICDVAHSVSRAPISHEYAILAFCQCWFFSLLFSVLIANVHIYLTWIHFWNANFCSNFVQLKYKLQFVLFVEKVCARFCSCCCFIAKNLISHSFLFSHKKTNERIFSHCSIRFVLFDWFVVFVVFVSVEEIFALNQTVRLSDFLHTEWLRLMEKSHERAL